MDGRPSQRRALCVGLSAFGDVNDEGPGSGYGPLRFAAERTALLADALTLNGYACDVRDERQLLTAKQLGTLVLDTLAGDGDGDAVQVVHVLSHGRLETSSVYVVGADGKHVPETSVAAWIARVEDFVDDRPPKTLFLVDTCHSGTAARLDWLRAAIPDTRAWLIASSQSHELSYDGRFSQAAATVLTQIANGEIDFYPAREFVPFGDVVEHIRREVLRLGGIGQFVVSTPVDGSPAPEFFPNRRPPIRQSLAPARDAADEAALPFLDLDVALDPAHFLDRASGRPLTGAAATDGCFTGRTIELGQLRDWLTAGAGGVQVVTGGAGSGKSALLGVVVCAAHPALRGPTRRLWEHLHASLPPAMPRIAAVHLRERSLADTLAALVRQLGLAVASVGPDEVLAGIARLRERPLIVMDAVDEAIGQADIVDKLLIPLALLERDGRAACHLIVGMRPWDWFSGLRNLAGDRGGLIDLDRVPVERLRGDLAAYVEDLLGFASRDEAQRNRLQRRDLAARVAQALTAPERDRGGEFLAAALFTNCVFGHGPLQLDHLRVEDATRLVPQSLYEILELDLSMRSDEPWLRPVLGAIAHGHGAGMPASIIRRIASAFLTGPDRDDVPPLTMERFDAVLQQVRFYLRSSPESDGTTLYRIFHQELVDHLRGTDVDLDVMLDALLATVPFDGAGLRRWESAEPYLGRHFVRHAVDAGRLDELVNEDPAVLEFSFNNTRTSAGQLASAIMQESRRSTALRGGHDRESWRDLLVVNAARYGAPQLAQRLVRARGLSRPAAWPRWSTGIGVSTIARAIISMHGGPIRSMVCAVLDGRPVAVVDDTSLQVWDLASGERVSTLKIGSTIWRRTLASTTVLGRPVIVITGYDKAIRLVDLTTGEQLGPEMPYWGTIGALSCVAGGDTALAVTGSDDRMVRIWDLVARRRVRIKSFGLDEIAAIDCIVVAGRALAVCGGKRGSVRVLDVGSGRWIGPSWKTGIAAVQAVACARVGDRPVAFVMDGAGSASLWDLETGSNVARSEPTFVRVSSAAVVRLDDRPLFATAGHDSIIRLWDPAEGLTVARRLTGHTGEVTAISGGQVDGRTVIVTSSRDQTLRVWDAESAGQSSPAQSPRGESIRASAVGEALGRRVGMTYGSHGLVEWDLKTGNRTGRSIALGEKSLNLLSGLELEGKPALVAAGPDAVRVFEFDSLAVQASIVWGAGTPVLGVSRFGDAGLTSLSTTGGRLILLTSSEVDQRKAKNEVLQIDPGMSHEVTVARCVALPDVMVVVAGYEDGAIRVWVADGGQQLGPTRYIPGGPAQLIDSAELGGRAVAITADEHAVRLWEYNRAVVSWTRSSRLTSFNRGPWCAASCGVARS